MGGGGSTRRVTFEADENENITVVKGVRLSDSVIDRMKEPSSPSGRQQRSSSAEADYTGDTEDFFFKTVLFIIVTVLSSRKQISRGRVSPTPT